MTNHRAYDLGFDAGWLAFAEELRTRLENAEEALASSDILEILDAELAHRDAAVHRRPLPAPSRRCRPAPSSPFLSPHPSRNRSRVTGWGMVALAGKSSRIRDGMVGGEFGLGL